MDVTPAALAAHGGARILVIRGKVSRHGSVIHPGNTEHYCGVTLKSAKSKEHCGN